MRTVVIVLALGASAFGHTYGAAASSPTPGAVEKCEQQGKRLYCWWEVPGGSVPGGDGGESDGGSGGGGEPVVPVTCRYVTAAEKTGRIETDPTVNSQVRLTEDGRVEVLYYRECTDGTWDWRWIADQPPPGAALPTPEELLPGARGELEKRLPKPTWQTLADTDPNGWAYVNTPTYFWLDDGVWTEQSAEASFGPVWVRPSAVPVTLVIDPGDHRGVVECDFEPPEYVRGTPTETFSGCSYRYPNSSALADNGESFAVTATLIWHATWQGSGGAGGDLGEMQTSVDPRLIPVAEVQAIVTNGG